MRNKFTELINQGVASFHHEARVQADQICQLYNRFWAMPSDTRMDLTSDGRRVITGSMLRDKEKWTQFCYTRFWGNVDFSTSGFYCLNDMWYQLKLRPQASTLNGDQCLELKPIPENQDCCGCCPVASADIKCTTNESNIPFLSHNLTPFIKQEFLTGSPLRSIVERLNETTGMKGWFLADDNNICIPAGNTIYKFHINEGMIGKKVECKTLRKLLDDEGLSDIYLVQNGRDFRIGSDAKEWVYALKKNPRFNLIKANNYSDYTPETWVSMIKDILATLN